MAQDFRHFVAVIDTGDGKHRIGYTRAPAGASDAEAWRKVEDDLANDFSCAWKLVALIDDADHAHPIGYLAGGVAQDRSDRAHL